MNKEEVITLTGYGLKVRVERGHLVLSDGIGENRRTIKLSKISKLKRLIVLGHTGFVSLDALRWLSDRGAALVVIDSDGKVLMAEAAMKLDYSKVRRAQAMAVASNAGLDIAKWLLRLKLEGQGASEKALDDLCAAPTLEAARHIEGEQADRYWRSWQDVEIMFDKPVPDHWTRFDRRRSPLSMGNHKAATPINGMLNFCYAILEAEVRIACLALGLDPGMGFCHADQPNRDNLVMDLMEPIRPKVDRFVRELVSAGLNSKLFYEGRDGHVRVLQPLVTILAETALKWREEVSPLAEALTQQLDSLLIPQPAVLRVVKGRVPLPTPLSQSRRSAGRPGNRKKAS